MRKSELGNSAESFACDYLERNGYQIIRRNFRVSGGEIDIIAENGDYKIRRL